MTHLGAHVKNPMSNALKAAATARGFGTNAQQKRKQHSGAKSSGLFHNFNVTKIKYDANAKNQVTVQHNKISPKVKVRPGEEQPPQRLVPYLEEEMQVLMNSEGGEFINTSAAEMNLSYNSDAVFRMKSGRVLKELQIQWEQFGEPDLNGPYPGSNTILIMPSFSHSSHAASSPDKPENGWWEFMVGPGKAIDTNKWHVVCPSLLGSPFGTSSSTTINPETGELYGKDFPQVTMEDIVNCHARLLDVLGLEKIYAVLGCSFGGMQSIQFGSMYPKRAEKVVSICGTAKTTPATMAVRMLQREVIALSGGDAAGFMLAKKLATVFYRSAEDINKKCEWYPVEKGKNDGTSIADSDGVASTAGVVKPKLDEDSNLFKSVDGKEDYYFDVQKYLGHVAEKALGYDPNCYLNLSTCMDLMELGSYVKVDGEVEGKKCMHRKQMAFSRIESDVLVMGVKQDKLIRIDEQLDIYTSLLAVGKKNVRFYEIDNFAGHDAVFAERNKEQFGPRLKEYFNEGRDIEHNETVDRSGLNSALAGLDVSTLNGKDSVDLNLQQRADLMFEKRSKSGRFKRNAKKQVDFLADVVLRPLEVGPENAEKVASQEPRAGSPPVRIQNGMVAVSDLKKQTGQAKRSLPFEISESSWLREIGKKSAVCELPLWDDSTGEFVEEGEVPHIRLFTKLEGMNPSGSIKDKAVTNIVLQMYANYQTRIDAESLVDLRHFDEKVGVAEAFTRSSSSGSPRSSSPSRGKSPQKNRATGMMTRMFSAVSSGMSKKSANTITAGVRMGLKSKRSSFSTDTSGATPSSSSSDDLQKTSSFPKELDPNGDMLALVTSGWAGVTLQKLHDTLVGESNVKLGSVIVIPAHYRDKPIPAQLLQSIQGNPNVVVHNGMSALKAFVGGNWDKERLSNTNKCHLVFEEGQFRDILADVHKIAKENNWNMLDQHYDENSYLAHRGTAMEIMRDVPHVTDVVLATGTGATAQGLRQFLPKHVNVHSRRSVSGTIDGCTDVNLYGNFCDPNALVGYNEEDVFQRENALEGKEQLFDRYGIGADEV